MYTISDSGDYTISDGGDYIPLVTVVIMYTISDSGDYIYHY
jgi:hypothetical protein